MLVSNSNRSNIYTNSSSSISSSSIISNWDNSNWDNSNLASLYSSMPLPWRTTSNKPACISPLLRSLHTTHVSNNRRSSSSSSSNVVVFSAIVVEEEEGSSYCGDAVASRPN
mmetsp:Transcript_44930/g.83336  ORF Transcript_44930/g.83336 Transcript_44930/m.83336 type:complete len:112 (+) Transcript_44930:3241-3576(+)